MVKFDIIKIINALKDVGFRNNLAWLANKGDIAAQCLIQVIKDMCFFANCSTSTGQSSLSDTARALIFTSAWIYKLSSTGLEPSLVAQVCPCDEEYGDISSRLGTNIIQFTDKNVTAEFSELLKSCAVVVSAPASKPPTSRLFAPAAPAPVSMPRPPEPQPLSVSDWDCCYEKGEAKKLEDGECSYWDLRLL
jgi:hypothetical protein